MFLNASKTPKFSDDPTELNCRITNAQDTEANIRFTVSWYYNKRLPGDDVVTEELLATMDADWTLLPGDRSRERTQNGEIIFSKKAVDTFSFRIQWTSESDRGDYFCVISAWSRHRNNSWIKSKDVTSASVSIFWATQGRNVAPICWRTWIAEIVFPWVGLSSGRPANRLWKKCPILWRGKPLLPCIKASYLWREVTTSMQWFEVEVQTRDMLIKLCLRLCELGCNCGRSGIQQWCWGHCSL